MIRLAVLVLLTLSIASCANTVRGVGKDLRDTADAVGDTISG